MKHNIIGLEHHDGSFHNPRSPICQCLYNYCYIYLFNEKNAWSSTHRSLFVYMCRLRDVRLLILEHSRWSTIQKYQAVLDGLSVHELMEFVGSFKSELYAEGLVQGNFTSTVSFHTFYTYTACIYFSRNIPDSKYPTNAADTLYSVLMYAWNIIK